MDLSKLNQIKQDAKNEISSSVTLEELLNLKNKYLAKKSELSGLSSILKDLSVQDKAIFGQELNQTKNEITSMLEEKIGQMQAKALNEKLKKEEIDITLPANKNLVGRINPFYLIQDEITDIFIGMGYEVYEGPDVESDHYNFERMNIPKDHPARDMQDSFFITENLLLRTHTSPAQAHCMEEKGGKPIKIICPGKTYRRDDDDATHSHQFAQIEGLVVDKNINIGNLKATLELFIKKMFGEKREIRLRSSFFPFTEPSVEIDVTCAECGGKGCSICKGTGYIEILGGGMVHPNVLKMSGYDPNIYSAFAFGIGIERVAMLRYGINDIRKFYTNDVRFISQFVKK